MPNEQIEASEELLENEETVEDGDLFESEDDMRRSLKRLCYGDLYVIGRIWIETLRNVLVGAKLSLVPVVKAAVPFMPPQKPPPMKYTDLPLYSSPHYEYKDYIKDKEKCPKANTKLLHELLYPHVRTIRKNTQKSFCELSHELKNIREDISCSFRCSKNNFKKYMRDPDNLALRQAVVAIGAAAGFYVGSGKVISKRVIFTGLGALAAGALCFPKETDDIFKNVAYHTGKIAVNVYNSYCGKNSVLRDKPLCEEDLPRNRK